MTDQPHGRRSLIVGLFLLITIAAFEATAVITALPTITEQFDGDSVYGLTVAVNLLANIVVIVAAARAADRHGPGRPLLVCAAVYAIGLTVAGLATGMTLVVLGRTLQGAGVGGFGTLAYVAVSRGIPEPRQPTALAAMSAGWVLPSLIAPAAAGWITETIGWRWVFLGMLPLLGAIVTFVAPMLWRLPAASEQTSGLALSDAIRAAVGLGAMLWVLTTDAWLVVGGVVVCGALIAGPALGRLFPPGMLRAKRGLPSVIAVRLVAAMAFLGVDSFMPLAADRIHGVGPTAQGMVIIGAALAWTVGQSIAARRHERTAPIRLMRTGLGVLAVGILATLTILDADVPLIVPFLAWSIGGLGQGLVYGPAGVRALALAPPGEDGVVSAQVNLADSIGFAVMGGVGGAIVATSDRGAVSLPVALATTTVLAALLAVTAVVVFAPRVEARAQTSAQPGSS